MMFPLAGRTFERMFEDFGSVSNLPLLTRLSVSVWFPFALSVPSVFLLALGLWPHAPLFKRRILTVFAFVFVCGASAVCLFGLYKPLIALADALK
jgi:hypothetical protein